jgi:hypothetical protein
MPLPPMMTAKQLHDMLVELIDEGLSDLPVVYHLADRGHVNLVRGTVVCREWNEVVSPSPVLELSAFDATPTRDRRAPLFSQLEFLRARSGELMNTSDGKSSLEMLLDDAPTVEQALENMAELARQLNDGAPASLGEHPVAEADSLASLFAPSYRLENVSANGCTYSIRTYEDGTSQIWNGRDWVPRIYSWSADVPGNRTSPARISVSRHGGVTLQFDREDPAVQGLLDAYRDGTRTVDYG